MNNLSLNFFGEKVDIKIPESLANLRQSISEKFLFSPSEAAEILITYGKDLGKKIIQTEKDFEDFIKKKIFNIDLDVDPKSQIFQKSLLKLQTESEENKIKLEVILKEMEEIKKQKKAKQDEAKIVIDEFEKKVKELNKKKNDIIQQLDKEIKENTSLINQVKKSSEKEIKSLDKKLKEMNKNADSLKEKLGIPVVKKPKLKSKAKPKPKPKAKKPSPKKETNYIKDTIKHFGDILKLNPEQIMNTLSQKYEFIKNYMNQKPEEAIHFQYICDGCNMAPIKGIRYHCEKCPDFDFCEKCYNSEKKTTHGHSFQAIKKPVIIIPIKKPTKICEKTVHSTVTCDGCGKRPLVGIRYKCAVCPNFDFCENCEKTEALKHGHPLVRLPHLKMIKSIKCNLKDSTKKELKENEKIIFENINCNGCGVKSIEGTRYKCAICKNFDYCEKCFNENCEKHDHPFIKIYNQNMNLESIKVVAWDDYYNKKPEEKKEKKETEIKDKKPIHYGVTCDGCKKAPIVGCR